MVAAAKLWQRDPGTAEGCPRSPGLGAMVVDPKL
jgi:hypothetical protein